MRLERREPVPKISPTAPADKIPLQIPLPPRVSADVIIRKRKVPKIHEKRRREAIIVLAVLQPLAVPIHRHHMDVQVVHRRTRMDSTHDLPFPVSARRQGIRRGVGAERILARPVLGGETAVFPPELGGGEGAELGRLCFYFREEGRVCEGVEGVEVGFGGVAREKEEVEGRFGEHVVDGDEVVVVVDDNVGWVCVWSGDVGA